MSDTKKCLNLHFYSMNLFDFISISVNTAFGGNIYPRSSEMLSVWGLLGVALLPCVRLDVHADW
jgi:hypothetical protein